MDDKMSFKEGLRLRGSRGRSSSVLPKHYTSSKELNKYSLPTPSSIYITILCFLVFLYAIIVEMEKRLPEPLLVEDEHNYPGRFIAQRAKNHILNLTSLGPRPTGSFENEVLAVNFFTREINSIFNKANKIHRISTDIQKVSGSFPLDFLDGMTNVYRNVQNVLVKIGPHKESPHSLLVNCHFDTVADSPGGSDDGASCAVMLELLRVISRSDSPLNHNVIFLFNGAEENLMQASHGFVTRHRWAREVRAFVNLEACGAGGRELLFQAGPEHPWLMEAYASSVPYPLASSLAQEIFQSGIIPGETDFRIFRDFGHISGLDFAWSSNGYVYHTKLDNAAQIPLGTLQRTGDNILPLVLRLVAAPEMGNVSAHRAGNLVFFDFLGAFIVTWSEPMAAFVNIAVVIVSIYVVRWNMKDTNRQGILRRDYLRQLLFCGLVILGWWLLSLACTAAIATTLTLLNRAMSWFSRPVWILFLYIIPSLLVSLATVLLAAKRLKKVVRSPWLQFRLFWDAHQLIFTLFLFIAIVTGIRSGFVCALWVAFACTANVLTQRTLAKYRDWRWIFIPVGVMLLPYIQNGYTVNGALLLVVPIMGRSGSGNHAELVLSLIATTMFVLLLTYIVPMILLVRNPQRVISLLSAIVFVALLTLVLTPLGFPYSSDPQNPTPQRFTIIHTDRMHHDENGAVREHKTGFWVVDMDVNSPRSVMTLVPEMAQASLIDEECRTELYCGLPYLIPVFSIVWQTHWIPGPQPNVAIKTELTLTQRELRPDNTIRLKFSVVGPDHMSLILSPKTGVRLSGWSVDSGEPLQGITFNGRPTYFIYYSYASDPEPWNFWVDFQVEGSGNDSGSGNVVDIGLSGHFLHGAHQRSVPLQRLLSKFPPWTVTTGWTAAYKSYIF
ncbi:endoplasmic reticulum metallopeptidase 1-like [Homalodisca vitripennis]|uniref:endoplasmic reticulum metallopeptidase 1-like n=1 Tax=Homalodisca vitripennis TaxID=197043 RepID=UPI001EEB6798|nr:endoplasmic reticulum metallopeptidase 1-like [Homalodisca vitripennis]